MGIDLSSWRCGFWKRLVYCLLVSSRKITNSDLCVCTVYSIRSHCFRSIHRFFDIALADELCSFRILFWFTPIVRGSSSNVVVCEDNRSHIDLIESESVRSNPQQQLHCDAICEAVFHLSVLFIACEPMHLTYCL